MKKAIISVLSLTIAALLSVPGEASAAREAKIIFMEGDVQLQRGGGAWTNAQKGLVLSSGDRIKTGPDSWAEIGIGKDYENVVRVQEQTLTEIKDLGPVQINLMNGELRALLEKLDPDETFEIMTPTAVCGARGTGWDTSTDGTQVTVDVYEDSIYFGKLSDTGEIMDDPIIKAGKRGVLEDPAKPIKIKNVPLNKKRDYGKWKKGFVQRRAVETGKGSGSQDQGEGGKEDLEDKVDTATKHKKSIEDMQKGKEDISDKLDQDDVENRTKSDSHGEPYP